MRQHLTDAEFEKLRTHIESVPTVENLALLLLIATGMRQSELVGITAGDFDDETQSVNVQGKKGSDSGQAPLRPETYARVARLRGELRRRTLGELLCEGSVESQKRVIRRRWDELCRKVLGYTPVGTHGARHTYAVKLFESGLDTREVQVLLRHKSIASTAKYLKHVTVERVKPKALKVVG